MYLVVFQGENHDRPDSSGRTIPDQKPENYIIDAGRAHAQKIQVIFWSASMGRPSDNWEEYRRPRGKAASISNALSRIQFDELCNVASRLNPDGKGCYVDRSIYAFGGDNIVFELSFNSGELWIARLRFPMDTADDINDFILESEAVTMRYLSANTSIPIPIVYGHDIRRNNSVGLPYLLMQAMPGKRLWGGGRTDYIPDQHKDKVYRQIADILIQLYAHPFDMIGMLHFAPERKSGVKVGPIFDGAHRIQPYGPFATAIDFYRQRAEMLNEYRANAAKPTIETDNEHVIAPEGEPERALSIVDTDTNLGPFRLSHPDFTVNNFLFDDEYNITALLDWSRCQTVPLESFANVPGSIVSDADQFLDGFDLPDKLRAEWMLRRHRFLDILRTCELERYGTKEITEMMESPRSYFAMCLDMYGILNIPSALPRREFDEFCTTLAKD